MSTLISDEYLEQLRLMRTAAHRPHWGGGGQRHVPVVLSLIAQYQPASLLDYGCGRGMILAELTKHTAGIKLAGYDPGMPEYAALPVPADMLISTDVLEHIEPDRIDDVLRHIRSLCTRVAYLNIHTERANAILPDGRNAHLIQQPAEWWKQKLLQSFSKVERVKGFEARRPSFLCE